MNILKSTLSLMVAFMAIFAMTSCGNESETNTDSVVEVKADTVAVVKTREELIINRNAMTFANPDSITEFENKHTPEITFGEKNAEGKTQISVKVGSNGIVHPTVAEHWIDFITLSVDSTEVERVEITNDGSAPEATFLADLSKAKEVTVTSGCNIHGIWKNTKAVKAGK